MYGKCVGKVVEQYYGSGSAELIDFFLDIYLGQLGKFAWISSQGRTPKLGRVKSGIFPISLSVGLGEIKPWGITGNYTWKGKENYKDETVSFEAITFPTHEAQHRVSWTFGEVEPVVRIYFKDKDITDTSSTDIIVGKKVKLKAKVFPEGYGEPHGKWEIGGKIVSGWEADERHAKVKPSEYYDKPQIEFFYVDGKFMGKPLKVSYSGEVNGKLI